MLIHLTITETFYNCNIAVTDLAGTRCFCFDGLEDDEKNNPHIDIEIIGTSFDITLTPETVNIDPLMDELDAPDWKSKFAKKAFGAVYKAVDDVVLRVGCSYHVEGVSHNDVIVINLQSYIFGTFDCFDLLGLQPIMYMYYEIDSNGNRFQLVNAFGINRKQVVKTAKYILGIGTLPNIFSFIITYPFQIFRVKRLTKDKNISRIIRRFHNMPDEKRQKKIDKMERMAKD